MLHKPRWYEWLLLGYKPVQHVAVLDTVGNCNTMASAFSLLLNSPCWFQPLFQDALES